MESKAMGPATSEGCAPDSYPQTEGEGSCDDIARSERNVREWMSYLPQDCVETMIRMGWDIST
jgi:hypothetical protein